MRIGLHRAEATREGTGLERQGGPRRCPDRGDSRQGEEILVSSDTAKAAGGSVAVSDPRTVSLKGIFEPVEVVAVAVALRGCERGDSNPQALSGTGS